MKDLSVAFLGAAILQFVGFVGSGIMALFKTDSSIFVSELGLLACFFIICFVFMAKLERIEEKLNKK